jgi:hypothetical protein
MEFMSCLVVMLSVHLPFVGTEAAGRDEATLVYSNQPSQLPDPLVASDNWSVAAVSVAVSSSSHSWHVVAAIITCKSRVSI